MARMTMPQTLAEWNERGRDNLPGHLGIEIVAIEADAGDVLWVAKPAHKGRSTQVWDAEVRAAKTGKAIAQFRCTQMILRKKH